MSTFETKVQAVTDFLVNRASLKRITSRQELAQVTADILVARAERHVSTPISYEKLYEVLKEVDRRSVDEYGFMLSVLVQRFWENDPGTRFRDRAGELGQTANHNIHQHLAFQKFKAPVPVRMEPEVPDDIEDLDDVCPECGALR